jgi:hypothetical protein
VTEPTGAEAAAAAKFERPAFSAAPRIAEAVPALGVTDPVASPPVNEENGLVMVFFRLSNLSASAEHPPRNAAATPAIAIRPNAVVRLNATRSLIAQLTRYSTPTSAVKRDGVKGRFKVNQKRLFPA